MANSYPFNIKGFHRQKPDDGRDFKFRATPRALANLPESHNLIADNQGRKLSGPFSNAWHQLQLGSCGLHSLGGNFMFDQMAAGVEAVKPSILFMYWCVRYLMGTVNQDSGVNNRVMMQALKQFGWCPESMWPYDINRYQVKPPQECFEAALANRLTEYRAIQQTQDQIKACIAGGPDMQGRPFVLGFTVFEEYMSDAVTRTGKVPMPTSRSRPAGGHDVLACAYNPNGVIFLNSYSNEWGEDGYGFLDWEYVLNNAIASDYWSAYWAKARPPQFAEGFDPSPRFILAA